MRTYDNIRKITTGQGDDYTTGCLHYKMIATDLSKQKALDVALKGIQQINFTGNLNRAGNTIVFFIIEKSKETHFKIFARKCENIVNLFHFNVTEGDSI